MGQANRLAQEEVTTFVRNIVTLISLACFVGFALAITIGPEPPGDLSLFKQEVRRIPVEEPVSLEPGSSEEPSALEQIDPASVPPRIEPKPEVDPLKDLLLDVEQRDEWLKKLPPQQNSWVNSGSGSAPRL